MKNLFALSLLILALTSCKNAKSEEQNQDNATSAQSLDTSSVDEASDAPLKAAMSVVEFVKRNRESPTGFSLPCQNGQKEFRRVNEEKKVDLRFCSHDGKTASMPMLRVGKDMNTLQAATYRASISHKTQDLTWIMNSGTVINHAPAIKEWKVMHSKAALTFKTGEKCPLSKEQKDELELVYGATFCSN